MGSMTFSTQSPRRHGRSLRALVLVAALGLIGSSTSWAVDRLVPSVYPTIAGAITAAAPGDTIRINGGTYNEALSWDKPLNFFAEADVTIKGDAATSSVLYLRPGSEGTSFGYMGAGKFIIDCEAITTSVTAVILSTVNADTGTTTTFENVKIHNAYGSNEVFDDALGYGVYVFRFLDVYNSGNYGVYAYYAAAAGVGSVYVFEHSRFITAKQAVLYSRFFDGTAIFRYCELSCLANITYSSPIFIDRTRQDLTIENSWVHKEGGQSCIVIGGYYVHTITIRNSALVRPGGIPISAGQRSYGSIVSIDHSDIIGDIAADGVIRYAFPNGTTNGNRNLTITNSNLINPSGFGVNDFGARVDQAFVADRVNAVVASTPFGTNPAGGWATYTVTNVLTPTTPDYSSTSTGHLNYTNSYLMTADSTGGPVGSAGAFSPEQFIVPVELSTFSLN